MNYHVCVILPKLPTEPVLLIIILSRGPTPSLHFPAEVKVTLYLKERPPSTSRIYAFPPSNKPENYDETGLLMLQGANCIHACTAANWLALL